MFPISDGTFVARGNRILAHDSTIEPHGSSFAATRVPEHFCRSAVGLGLSIMHAGRPVGAIQLIDPLTVFAAVDCSVVRIWHIGYVLMFWWTESSSLNLSAGHAVGMGRFRDCPCRGSGRCVRG